MGEHATDILGARDVRLNDESIGAGSPDLRGRIVGGICILAVIDGYLDTLRCQLEGNAPANPA